MHREPIFNIPAVIVGLIAVMAAIYFIDAYLLSEKQHAEFMALFAFVPDRYETGVIGNQWPGGVGAEIWTFVTYAFLHANAPHLIANVVWLLPFGSAVARRFGAVRFLLFFALTAAAGALAQYAMFVGQKFALVGASAAISGTMAAAMRFAFQRGGPLSFWRSGDDESYRVPALPLSGILSDRRVLLFLFVWFGLNFLFGAGAVSLNESDQPVAWQAHVGGFLAGLLLFGLFDPPPQKSLPPTTAAPQQ